MTTAALGEAFPFLQRLNEWRLRAWAALVPEEAQERAAMRLALIRIVVAANLLLGIYYMTWRYVYSINWNAWPVALALLAAETYSFLDSCLFGLMMWNLKQRPVPPPPPEGATVDVFITCYNEPVELVRETALAALHIRHPHKVYVLDDGNSAAMRAMTEEIGCGYIVRSKDWIGKDRHAKAGNLNNAMFQTNGEFLLILDADQIPYPQILDHVLGYFRDPKVAFVQTPQWFYNVPKGDPFGSQAPLFYGPIQQGKDGLNAAFFCGSNAVLRREALMFIGIWNYVNELEKRVQLALKTARSALKREEKRLTKENEEMRLALKELQAAVKRARLLLKKGTPIQEITWIFQRRVEAVARRLVAADLARIRAELEEIPGVDLTELGVGRTEIVGSDDALKVLAARDASPLAALEAVRELIYALDVDRQHEAQPVMPMSTISVTEDMATAMRMHSLGWKSIYHHEILVRGLAPEDLRTALQQRLRWSQGTIQVALRENPLRIKGLSWGQKLMYAATMWSYFSGFFAVIYLSAPILYLLFGLLPIRAFTVDFMWHHAPDLVMNQILFLIVGWKIPTWRGQQYSLALFPLWIKAVTSAVKNVYFGTKLGFVVTSKTRQGGVSWRPVWPQLVFMGLLVLASVWGLLRLSLGWTSDGGPILANVFWSCYDLVCLSVILEAITYQPEDEDTETALSLPTDPQASSAGLFGRAGAGRLA